MILLITKIWENKEELIQKNSVKTIFFVHYYGIITLGGVDER